MDLNKYNFIIGVPFTGIEKILEGKDCLFVAREDQAIAMAFGALMMNKRPVVIMQNNGLGLSLDVLTSLIIPSKIEIPLIIYNRIKPYHHAYMGKITKNIMELLDYKEVYYVEQM